MAITALLDLTLDRAALAEAPAVVTETLRATRAFDGCLGADVVVDTEDETHVVVVERWESLEHDQAYRDWRKTPEGASPLGAVLAGPPRLTRLTSTDW